MRFTWHGAAKEGANPKVRRPYILKGLQNVQYIKFKDSKFFVGRTDRILWNPILDTLWYVLKCGMVTFWVDGPWGYPPSQMHRANDSDFDLKDGKYRSRQ